MMVQVERRRKQRPWYHQLLLPCQDRWCFRRNNNNNNKSSRVSSVLTLPLTIIVGLWIINQVIQNANDNGIFSFSSSSSKTRHITPKQLGLPPVPRLHMGSYNIHGNTTTSTTTTSPSATTYWCYLDKELTGGMFRSSLHMPYMVQWIAGCWSWFEDQNNKNNKEETSSSAASSTTTTTTINDNHNNRVGIALDDVMYSRFVSSPNFPNWNRPFFQALNIPILIVNNKKKKGSSRKQRLKKGNMIRTDKNDQYGDMIYDQLVSLDSHHHDGDGDVVGEDEDHVVTTTSSIGGSGGDSTKSINSEHQEKHQGNTRGELVQVYTSKKFGGIEWFGNTHSCSTLRQRLWDALKLTTTTSTSTSTTSTTNNQSNNTANHNGDDENVIRIGFVERPARRLIFNSSGLAKALQQDYDDNNEQTYKVHVSYEVISDDGEYNTMYEQGLWYYTQDVVIMAHGAGTTNVIFMKPGTQLLEMFPHNFFFELYKPLVEECNVNHYYYYDYDNSSTTKGHYDHHTTGNPTLDFQDHFKERGRNRNVNIYITYQELKSQVDTMIQKLLSNRRQRQEEQQRQ